MDNNNYENELNKLTVIDGLREQSDRDRKQIDKLKEENRHLQLQLDCAKVTSTIANIRDECDKTIADITKDLSAKYGVNVHVCLCCENELCTEQCFSTSDGISFYID